MPTMTARIIHISIERPWQDVHAYASQPEKMAEWASGLAAGLHREGDHWVGNGGPIGNIQIRFAPPNGFGVIDHRVSLGDSTVVNNALRIVENGDGAEVMFTLLKSPMSTQAEFEADAAHVLRDLETLKTRMEAG